MIRSDNLIFLQLLDDVWTLFSQPVLTPRQKAMWIRAMAEYSLEEIQRALDAHVKDPDRGRFLPKPADVIAKISGVAVDDGRPGADEAWAVAMRSADESETVVWTQEMAQAWNLCRPVYGSGDEIGARFAFREAYNRLVEAARHARQPAVWDVALGFDVDGRGAAVQRAVEQGRLTASGARDVLLLDGPKPSLADLLASKDAPPAAREALHRAREALLSKTTSPGPDAEAKVRTAELKSLADERIRRRT